MITALQFALLKISAENTCFGYKTYFSVINFSGAKTFLWNFGDGETSDEISPSHLYKKSGSYKVKLLIDTNADYETDIEIYPKPKSPKVIIKTQ
jgi:PKD repeat protein